MRKTTRLMLMLTGLLAGCQTVQPITRMPFPEAEYRALPRTGTGRIQGQAFLKTMGGHVKTAAGNDVLLNPVTSYSEQWHLAYRHNQPLEPRESDSRVKPYTRTTVADGEGRFEFTHVPAGEYFLVTTVAWYAPTGYRGGLRSQGGLIVDRIVVAEGETKKVILTR